MTEYVSRDDLEEAFESLDPVLSTRFRREFFGRSRLDKLERILGRPIPPGELLRLILREEGANLLARRRRRIGRGTTSVRHKLLDVLSEEGARRLFAALEPNKGAPAQRGAIVNRLADYNWHRGRRGARLITRALGLPDSFAGVREQGKRDSSYEILPFPQLPLLKPFQKGILRELDQCLQERRRAMVSSFTGTGKTRMGMEYAIDGLASSDGEGVLWIAQKRELLDQACDSIEQLWPWKTQSLGEALNVFRFMEGASFEAHEIPDRPFLMIATSQQVQARLESGDPFLVEAMRRSRLMVVDEAHFSLAPGHQRIIEAYEGARNGTESKVLGLTATPGRSNLVDASESLRLAELFDRQLVVPDVADGASALEWFQEQEYLSRLEHQIVPADSQIAQTAAKRGVRTEDDLNGMRDYTPEFLSVVGEDSIRNRAIVEQIVRLDEEGRHALVFCCNIEQAQILFETLALRGVPCGIIHHRIDRRDRRNTIQQFRNREIRILLNVEVLTTGFDAPKVDTIVMCRPTLSRVLYEQMIGRGMRGPEMGGTESCTIVDFTTNFSIFDEPQAWEAFWEDWNAETQAPLEAASLFGDGWDIRRARPEHDSEIESEVMADLASAHSSRNGS